MRKWGTRVVKPGPSTLLKVLHFLADAVIHPDNHPLTNSRAFVGRDEFAFEATQHLKYSLSLLL